MRHLLICTTVTFQVDEDGGGDIFRRRWVTLDFEKQPYICLFRYIYPTEAHIWGCTKEKAVKRILFIGLSANHALLYIKHFEKVLPLVRLNFFNCSWAVYQILRSNMEEHVSLDFTYFLFWLWPCRIAMTQACSVPPYHLHPVADHHPPYALPLRK